MTGLEVFILISVIISVPILIGLLIYVTYKSHIKTIEYDQYLLTDKELLQLIAQHPGGLISSKQLSDITPLDKKQSRARLNYLLHQKILKNHYDSSFTYYYSLKTPIDSRPAPALSDKPFLTVEDILTLFKHHNHQLTVQDVCIDTGLPIPVIKREFKYFIKEKIVKLLYTNEGGTQSISYILNEPYRNNPDAFLEKEAQINFELEEILEPEMRKYKQ